MRLLSFVLAATFAAPVIAAPAATPVVTGAAVRANPAPGRPASGYFSLASPRADRLVAVTAPGVRIELHSMDMAGGIMRMRRIDGADVPAGGRLTFAPDGDHLMIFGLNPAVKALPLTFRMKSGAAVTVSAPVRSAMDDMPGHAH